MKPLVVIPARGGSKGIPRKNIKKLGGKPLIHYTIDAAREVFSDQFICVSTDDREIKEIAENSGLEVPFLRPSHYAEDSSGMREVLLHAIDYYRDHRNYESDTVILLQPTSPFRRSKDIRQAMEYYEPHIDGVLSVKETDANPYYLLYEENERGYLEKSKKGDFTRRQDCPKVWELNGAIYILSIPSLRQKEVFQFEKTVKYVMDEIHSIDIDNPLDWELAEIILKKYYR